MSNRSVLSVCAFGLIVAAVVTGFATAGQESNVKKQSTSWEHLALPHQGQEFRGGGELSKQINRLGNDGWELVDVTAYTHAGTTETTVYFFKRPK